MGKNGFTYFQTNKFIRSLRERDPKTMELVVRSYTDHLYKGALGLGFDVYFARELVQNVWITFFDVIPNFKAQSHVRTFLFGILYNKARELRREQKKNDHDSIEGVLESRFNENGKWIRPPINPEKFMATIETLGIIDKCLDGLPLNQRMAFCLKEIDGLSSSEICKILNVTITNLGVLLYRAKNRLRECIEGKIKV